MQGLKIWICYLLIPILLIFQTTLFKSNEQMLMKFGFSLTGSSQDQQVNNYEFTVINTQVTKVLLLPLVPKRGSMDPLRKPLSHRNFAMKFATIFVRAIKNHNSVKKILKCCTVSKWRPNNRFLFRVILILAKFWKTTFPKEFFNEIWLREGKYQ